MLTGGSLWLLSTIQLDELILNAVALNFAFSIDELLFQLMIPSRVQAIVSILEPLHLRQSRKKFGFRFAPRQLVCSILVGSMSLLVVMQLSPRITLMEQIKTEVCGGDRDFVFTISPMGEPLYSPVSDFQSYGQNPLGEAREHVVDMARKSEGAQAKVAHLADKGYIWAVSHTQHKAKAVEGIDERVRDLWCQDTQDANYFNPYVTTGNMSVASCIEAKPYCAGDLASIRAFCPVTCGCNDPLSGLTLGQDGFGCPPSCQSEGNYLTILAKLNCTDMTPQALAGHGGWLYFETNAPKLDDQGWTFGGWPLSIQETMQSFASKGCELFKSVPGLCSFGGRAFCPTTCECDKKWWRAGCPSSCKSTR